MVKTLKDRLSNAVTDCVIIDCETTGLDPSSDRIIEIAVLQLIDGRAVADYHALINPGRPLPRDISELTGVTDDDLADAGNVDTVVDHVHDLVSGRTVVGHNVAFDIAFLNAEMTRGGRYTGLGEADALCTASTARDLIPRAVVGRYRLSTLAETLRLAHHPAHRAVADVRATADLLTHLHRVASA